MSQTVSDNNYKMITLGMIRLGKVRFYIQLNSQLQTCFIYPNVFVLLKKLLNIMKQVSFVFFSLKSLEGSEFPVLVFFGNRLDGMHNNEVFSRCISNLILIINKSEVESLSLDANRSQIITIYGLYFTFFWLG